MLQNSAFLNQPSENFLLAGITLTATILGLYLIRALIISRLQLKTKASENKWDDLIIRIFKNVLQWPAILIIALNIGMLFLEIPETADKYIRYLNLFFICFYAAKLVAQIIDFVAKQYILKTIVEEDEQENQQSAIVKLVVHLAKALVWIIAFLVLLQNAGVNVSALIAGLGVGGIAIAFALQSIVEDGFSALSIYFDKPFKIGDTIKIDQQLATANSVGIKTSRFTTLYGDELVIPNRELTSKQIRNYGEINERRVSFSLGVTYDTDNKQLEAIPGYVEEIVNQVEHAEFSRTHLLHFGNSALIFDVVYHVKDVGFQQYTDIKAEINLAILRKFRLEKIEFAYPSQTVYLEKAGK